MGPLCRLYYSLSPFHEVHFWDFLLNQPDAGGGARRAAAAHGGGRTLAPGGPGERNRRFAQKPFQLLPFSPGACLMDFASEKSTASAFCGICFRKTKVEKFLII